MLDAKPNLAAAIEARSDMRVFVRRTRVGTAEAGEIVKDGVAIAASERTAIRTGAAEQERT